MVVGFLENWASSEVRLDVWSFVANIKNGKMAMTGQMEDGTVSFSGKPATVLPDLAGVWNINKTTQVNKKSKKGTKTYTEIFNVTPVDESLGDPAYNLYALTGAGVNFPGGAADLCVWGMAILSKGTYPNGNNLNIALWEYEMPDSQDCSEVDRESNWVGSATTGLLNYETRKGKLVGTQNQKPPYVIMPVFCHY